MTDKEKTINAEWERPLRDIFNQARLVTAIQP